jgi:hypothetical protein
MWVKSNFVSCIIRQDLSTSVHDLSLESPSPSSLCDH